MVSHVKKIMWIVEIIYLVNHMKLPFIIIAILIFNQVIGLNNFVRNDCLTYSVILKDRSERLAKITINGIGIRG